MKTSKFTDLYQCNIDTTKQLVSKPFDPLNDAYTKDQVLTYTEEKTVVTYVTIKMLESEYDRFNQNWEQYLTLMAVARDNPRIKEEYHKLLMMTNLLA